jgi:hypothetical protein
VQGHYSPQQPTSGQPSEPVIERPQNGPSNGIPAWVLSHLKDLSPDDSTRVQQLYMERHDLQQQLQDPAGDALQTVLDVLGAWTKQPDSPPIQEERHQQRVRINEINEELQQIFDRNDIAASPFGDDTPSQPSTQSANPGSGDDGDFTIHTSDSTASGLPGQLGQPVPSDNGIAIQIEFVSNANLTEMESNAPISIQSSLLPDAQPVISDSSWSTSSNSNAGARQPSQPSAAVGSPKRGFWDKLNSVVQGFSDFAQSDEGRQLFQSLQSLSSAPTAGASNGSGSANQGACGPGYKVNPGAIAAAKAPWDPFSKQLPPWRDPKYGPLDSSGRVAWCIPANK